MNLRRLLSPRALRILLAVLAVLIVLGLVLDRGLDRPLRRIVERRINESLIGYSARVGSLDFHLLGLSLDLNDMVVWQDAHPEPPVLIAPRLTMGVHWLDLLRLRLVADALFEGPAIHADLVQLREENRDDVPIARRGWQHALESIYPLKINELRVVNGSVEYQDDSGFPPLHVSGVALQARNIRNIRSADRQYPSELHAEGWVFDAGRAVIDGYADFLAEPTPGVQGHIDLERIELSYFEPIARRFGLTLRQGFVDGSGTVEVAPRIRTVDIDSVVITAAVVDYLHDGAPTAMAAAAKPKITRAAHEAMNNPEVLYRIRRLTLDNGTVGVINRVQDPPYRIYVSNASLEMSNASTRAEDGPAQVALRGAFMGSGSVRGEGTLYPEGQQANFGAKLAIQGTQLASLNDLLRARGNFDVSEGTFSLYSEVRVQDGYIDGYVKPLFRDIKVYDAEQDKHDNPFHKMYEGIVGCIVKLLENDKDRVATVASLRGPVEDPKANALEVLGGLLRNAFVHAILPGFQQHIARLEPLKYRAAKKKERREEREALR